MPENWSQSPRIVFKLGNKHLVTSVKNWDVFLFLLKFILLQLEVYGYTATKTLQAALNSTFATHQFTSLFPRPEQCFTRPFVTLI
jgi:hypothetical protein